MLKALSASFSQTFDPAFRRVFIRSLLGSVATFVLLWLGCWFALGWLGEELGVWLASTDLWGFLKEFLIWLFGAGAIAGVVVASFLLFPTVMMLVMSFFLEDIAAAVETRHYPGQTAARKQAFGEILVGALGLLAATLVVNFLALPFYLILLFLTPLNLLLFYLVNGYLLGREYFELVAVRRLDLPESKRLRRRYRMRVLFAGAIIAFLLTVPLLNLVTPIVATAFMVHVFEDLRRRAAKTS